MLTPMMGERRAFSLTALRLEVGKLYDRDGISDTHPEVSEAVGIRARRDGAVFRKSAKVP